MKQVPTRKFGSGFVELLRFRKHGGSASHGCSALKRGITEILMNTNDAEMLKKILLAAVASREYKEANRARSWNGGGEETG